MKNVALIVAGGQGTRFNSEVPKQYLQLNGIEILKLTIKQFYYHSNINAVKVVISRGHEQLYEKATKEFSEKLLPYSYGGERRQDSVLNGLLDLKQYNPQKILIHDAARPFVNNTIISKVIDELQQWMAVDTGISVIDTIKSRHPVNILSRDNFYLTHTPQGFDYPLILKLHQKYNAETFTDDISLCIKEGTEFGFIESTRDNIKITTDQDFKYAELYMNSNYITRIGYGFDIHKFIEPTKKNNSIMLAGIPVEHNKALAAHSDGDVVLHALTDAILGAIGEDDIGMHFPPTDPKWKNSDSTIFLKHAHKLMLEKGGMINNIDITIVTERPKLMNYKNLMRKKIAELLLISDNQVSVKAKTSEKLGFVGREEGISTSAVCALMLPVNFERQVE